ncbi:MAG: prepilin-type N-terminal cleavage/methylation domain-containing protein [Candidatus Syntrophosphaera sp.]|nr:prepilin-type N-terminal cleavage/methylation domain-containing protein [Candidatus Syntrophosphaera sp.]
MIETPALSASSESPGLLRRQQGMTLLEVIVVMLIIVVMVISIYIGIVYAERQLLTNYRDRVATLLLNGELEMEYYRYSRSNPFQLQANVQYVIDDLNPDHIQHAYMTIERKTGQETSNEQLLNFVYLEATMRWTDQVTQKERFIRMREDYFLPNTGP